MYIWQCLHFHSTANALWMRYHCVGGWSLYSLNIFNVWEETEARIIFFLLRVQLQATLVLSFVQSADWDIQLRNSTVTDLLNFLEED